MPRAPRRTRGPESTPTERRQSISGEPFVFTQFAGEPQCFLTEAQLLSELAVAGFAPITRLVEHNLPAPGRLQRGGPVIYEGTFRLGGG